MDPYRNPYESYNLEGHPYFPQQYHPPEMDPYRNPYQSCTPEEHPCSPNYHHRPYSPPRDVPHFDGLYDPELHHYFPEAPQQPYMPPYEIPHPEPQYHIPPQYPPTQTFPYPPPIIPTTPYPPYELPGQPPASEHAYTPTPYASEHAYTPTPCASEHAYTPTPSTDTELPQGQLVKIFCKSDRDFNLAARHDGVVMVPSDPEDETQQWIKDDTPGIRVKDTFGFPAFSLTNKGHRKLLKHAKDKGQQVLLEDYQPVILDDDFLWTESQDFGEGYKTIRMVDDPSLNLTVFRGDKKLGGVKDGSPIVLDTWHKHGSQLWKIFPF